MNNQIGSSAFATPEQELLLRAAWLTGDPAWQAWQHWKARINLEQNLDADSYRLLPLVYHNLHALGTNDPLLIKIKGIYRKEWYKNQMHFDTTAEVLSLFQAAGIETLLLKGAAIVFQYYTDYALRPMEAVDILIPTAKRSAAIEVLTHAGWKPRLRLSPDRLATGTIPEARHNWGFEDATQQQLVLHWNALLECRYPKADDDFWAGSVPLRLAEVSTSALNPTDQLLHICAQTLIGEGAPPVQWIADALMILRAANSKIDWSRLSAQAKKRRLTLMLCHTLTYLRDSFGTAIPAHVLAELNQVQVSEIERKLYTSIMTKPNVLSRLPQHWYRHSFDLAAVGKTNWLQRLIRFPRYLQGSKAMDLRHLLAWSISRPFVRISRAVRGLDQSLK